VKIRHPIFLPHPVQEVGGDVRDECRRRFKASLQVSFRTRDPIISGSFADRDLQLMALLRKEIYEDKASYSSSPTRSRKRRMRMIRKKMTRKMPHLYTSVKMRKAVSAKKPLMIGALAHLTGLLCGMQRKQFLLVRKKPHLYPHKSPYHQWLLCRKRRAT